MSDLTVKYVREALFNDLSLTCAVDRCHEALMAIETARWHGSTGHLIKAEKELRLAANEVARSSRMAKKVEKKGEKR